MKVHFIAIGGSAMHNLAIALKINDHFVSGSDDVINEQYKCSRQVRIISHQIVSSSGAHTVMVGANAPLDSHNSPLITSYA